MAPKELLLQGSYKGVKKCVEMKKYDITHSTIQCLGQKCYQPKKIMTHLINQVSIKKSDDKKDTYSIYHMYNSLDKDHKIYYSGRWYHGAFVFDKKSINEKEHCIQTKMTFQDQDTFKEYKVKIKIYFNESGWNKLQIFLLR